MVFWNSFGLLNQEFSLDSNTFVTYWTDLNEIFLQLSALHSICVEKQSFTHTAPCMSLFSFSVAGFDLWKKISTVCSYYLKHQKVYATLKK